MSGVGTLEAAESVHQGGLTGAVGADQAEDLAAGEREIDAVHRTKAAEMDVEVTGFEYPRGTYHSGGPTSLRGW